MWSGCRSFILLMSPCKVLLWDGSRQARAKMRDGWPGANCHPDVFEQSIFSVCSCVPWDLVLLTFDWEHTACPCFPCLHWTTDFSAWWVLETRWLMKFALVRTASSSILSNWFREKKTLRTTLHAGTTPSEKRLWILSWTGSASWQIIALATPLCFGYNFGLNFHTSFNASNNINNSNSNNNNNNNDNNNNNNNNVFVNV